MARLADIVIDCTHPASLARFWAEVLDDYEIAPYDDEELERLATAGVADPEDDPTVLLLPLGAGPRIWLQKVPERKAVKNRVHLDVRAADLETEVVRLTALGAKEIGRTPTKHLVTMQDPEGNEFCVIAKHSGGVSKP